MELIYDAGFWSVCHGCKSQNGAVNGVELILDCKSVITRHPLYKLRYDALHTLPPLSILSIVASTVSIVADQSTRPETGPSFSSDGRHATLSQEVELLESGRFHTPVLQPGINSSNVYTTYQTLLLLENT